MKEVKITKNENNELVIGNPGEAFDENGLINKGTFNFYPNFLKAKEVQVLCSSLKKIPDEEISEFLIQSFEDLMELGQYKIAWEKFISRLNSKGVTLKNSGFLPAYLTDSQDIVTEAFCPFTITEKQWEEMGANLSFKDVKGIWGETDRIEDTANFLLWLVSPDKDEEFTKTNADFVQFLQEAGVY